MAVSSTDAVNLALREAGSTLESGSATGKKRVWLDTLALVTADTSDDGDIWYIAEVPSNAKVTKILVRNDVVDAHATPTLDCNIGIYNGPTKFTTSAGTSYAAGS